MATDGVHTRVQRTAPAGGSEGRGPAGRPAPTPGRGGALRDRPWAVAAAVAGLLIPIGVYFFYVVHYSVDALFYDDWSLVPVVHAALHGRLTLQMLWAQHNENRMFVPNLVFVAFGWLDHFDTRSIIIFDAPVYALSFLAYARLYLSYAGRWMGLVPAVAVGLVWFSFEDYENSLWAFQLAWFLIVFLMMAMLLFLARRNLTRWAIAGAALCAAAASFSSIQGLILWPVGLLCLLWRVRGRPVMAAAGGWVGAALVTAGVYFWGFGFGAQSTGGGSISYGLGHLGSCARYVLIEMGNVFPTSAGPDYGLHEALGAVVAVAALWVVYGSLRHHREPTRIPLPLALIGFAVCFDVLTAIGRLSLGLAGALSSRYTMGNLLLLIGMATYFLEVVGPVGGRTGRRRLRDLAWAAPVVVVLAAQIAVADPFGAAQGRAVRQTRLTDAAVSVNFDRATPQVQKVDAPRYVYPSVPALKAFLAEARTDHLSVFAPGAYRHYRRAGLP